MSTATGKSDTFVRFTLRQRLEHVAMILLFTVLAVTGFPQKFHGSGWAQTVIQYVGGVKTAQLLHRFAGACFAILVVVHLGLALVGVLRRKTRISAMVPTRKDFTDAIQNLRYYLGRTKEMPRFDRFDYRQKFEYWGLVFGATVMAATGVILLYPVEVANLLPGELIPVAKVAHSNEGLMAFLVVIVWHIYNAHLNPDVFPFDTSIFTGRISRERMHHEHPLELERLEPPEPPPPATETAAGTEDAGAPRAGSG